MMTKSQAYKRRVKADRIAWRDSMPDVCMHCGHRFYQYATDGAYRWPEIHEILSKSELPNAWGFRANYLKLCQACHPVVAAMPDACQLAIKKLRDRKHYNLKEWLRRRNANAMEHVTEYDVEEWCRRLA